MDAYRSILIAKKSELERSLRNRGDITVEHAADELEHIHNMESLEMEIRAKDRESVLLREVKEALSRLDEDTFGICLECDEPISQKRLQAVPWAALCVGCQQKAEEAAKYEHVALNAGQEDVETAYGSEVWRRR